MTITRQEKVLPTSWSIDASAPLSEVFEWCLQRRNTNRLILATPLDPAARRPTLLARQVDVFVRKFFRGRVLQTLLAKSWPGTQLTGHFEKVYVVAFDSELGRRMSETASHLSQWTQWHSPSLPEDLCLFREGDAAPVLVSVTHEGEAWLLHNGPSVPRWARRERYTTVLSMIPSAGWFVDGYVWDRGRSMRGGGA